MEIKTKYPYIYNQSAGDLWWHREVKLPAIHRTEMMEGLSEALTVWII